MATPTITPPVAAPAAAAPTPAPVSTPVSTPAAPVTTPVAAPETSSAPVVTPAAAPASTKPDPKAEIYREHPEQFLADQRKYRAEHPEGEEAPAADAAPAEAAPTEAAKPEEEAAKPAEAAAEPDFDDVPDVTPQSLTEMTAKNPALKDLFDKDPETKNAFYKMARENAQFKPIAQHFPDEESAKFAKETANQFVGLKSSFEFADTPEQFDKAFEGFVDQFKIVDDKGNPVLEADGSPKLGKDYYQFMDTAVGRYLNGAISEVEERVKANQYANGDAREADQQRLLALNFIKEDAAAEEKGPDLSTLPANVRADLERRENELKAREEKAGINNEKRSRAESNQRFVSKSGGRIKSVFDTTISAIEKAGGYVPKYLVESPDGKTPPQFVKSVIDQYNQVIGSDPKIRRDLTALEALAPTPENEQRRLEYVDKLYQANMPRLIRAELRKITTKINDDVTAHTASRDKAAAKVTPEPRGGTAPTPQTWTQESSMAEAKRIVKEQFGNTIDPSDANRLALTAARALRSGQKMPDLKRLQQGY